MRSKDIDYDDDGTSYELVMEVLDGYFKKNYIFKEKINEKLKQINDEYSILVSDKSLSLEQQNINAQRHEAMQTVLEELLEEN